VSTPASIDHSHLSTRQVVQRLTSIAVEALAAMFQPQQRLFCFRLRPSQAAPGYTVPQGVSHRYTATVLIGLAGQELQLADNVLHHLSAGHVCSALLADLDRTGDLGQVALTLWACRLLEHPGSAQALKRLQATDPANTPCPTVELAWSLTALTADANAPTDKLLAQAVARRLINSFNPHSELFPHWPHWETMTSLRRHVTCFADLVYPIQALAHYHRAAGDAQALDIASRCAARMCQLQGPAGQWWWHYDCRTGKVIEKYPVYSVHQDSMAPMALFALKRAGGHDHQQAVERSLAWLERPPEIPNSLIDTQANVIWRKVARREPGKLARSANALASRLHPAMRVPALDALLPPRAIDYESRPYHMGWILHAWSSP